MSVIHGGSHAALKYFREKPAALAVYWLYVSRTNHEGVAWPSLRGLETSTGWNKDTCAEARDWLVFVGALEPVEKYVRPQWREMEAKDLRRRKNLDHAQYFRMTGYIEVGGTRTPMLYAPQMEAAPDVDDTSADEGAMSDATGRQAAPTNDSADERQRRTELNTSLQLDSTLELDTSSSPAREEPFNIFTLYHETFAMLVANPILADELKDIAATYPEQDIRDAFKETARANAKSIKYTVAILSRWKQEGRSAPKAAASKTRPAPKPAPSPADERLKALKAEILATLPDTPPDTYLPDGSAIPGESRLTAWQRAGRPGMAKRLAEAQLAKEPA
jgi:hypothetical protein